MKQISAASILVLLLALISACGRNALPPVAAAAKTPPPQLPIKAAKFLDAAAPPGSSTSAATNLIHWEVLIAEFSQDAIEQHGLMALFDRAVEKNGIISEEIPRSHLVATAQAASNILLNLSAGVYAGICSADAASNLVSYFQRTTGVDLLTYPQAMTSGTNQAQLYVGNNIPVLIGASSNASPATPFLTNFSFGPTVTLRPLFSNPNILQLQVAARFDEFGGYSHDDKNPRSQLTIGQAPIFNVSVLGTRTALSTNEVLLLGSPTITNVRKTIERVPTLSDIPAIGRLFTRTHVETNFVRRLLIIIPHDE
jgi:type II secretory pathway component GspD/PulD (secretin)